MPVQIEALDLDSIDNLKSFSAALSDAAPRSQKAKPDRTRGGCVLATGQGVVPEVTHFAQNAAWLPSDHHGWCVVGAAWLSRSTSWNRPEMPSFANTCVR
jgi:hypothetical protein